MQRTREPDEYHSNLKRPKSDVSRTFSVFPVNKFNQSFPCFRQPKEIGYFSVYTENEVAFNRTLLKYLYDKNIRSGLSLDLRDGYNSFISKNCDGPGDISSLLKWFEMHFDDKNKYFSQKPDFFCWRGLLTKLLTTPYEKSEGWIFAAEKCNGTIFLVEIETHQKKEFNKNMTKEHVEMTYWGFKFEQYMTTDKSDDCPVTDVPVDNTKSFVSVVRTVLGEHSLIFGGEVDCCTKENIQEYVELKTSRRIETEKQRNNFNRYKLLKWWAQSFLLGIPKIVCGFRNDDGIVEGTETFDTLKLPRIARECQYPWLGNVCFNFCKDLLQFVKDNVLQDDRIYKFVWSPGQDVTCEVATDIEILTQNFKDKLKNLC